MSLQFRKEGIIFEWVKLHFLSLFLKNYPSRILCVMKLSPSFARHEVDSLFTLLSKYAAGIRCTVEIRSLQKHLSIIPHAEDDDTNQSVSSIEDDFVTALEHLDEDEPTKMINSG